MNGLVMLLVVVAYLRAWVVEERKGKSEGERSWEVFDTTRDEMEKKWGPALNGFSIVHTGQLQAMGALAGEGLPCFRLCAPLVVAEEARQEAEKSISHLLEP